MTHRFQAPEHTSEVFTPGGPRRADKNGVISLPADAPAADHAALAQAGCTPIAADEAGAEKPRAPAKPKSSSKKAGKAKAKPAAPAPEKAPEPGA